VALGEAADIFTGCWRLLKLKLLARTASVFKFFKELVFTNSWEPAKFYLTVTFYNHDMRSQHPRIPPFAKSAKNGTPPLL
jgi:hypothetical protein